VGQVVLYPEYDKPCPHEAEADELGRRERFFEYEDPDKKKPMGSCFFAAPYNIVLLWRVPFA
jgi:hypothetical protein